MASPLLTVLSSIGPMLGVVVGWWLNQLGNRNQRRADALRRLNELRLATYSEWFLGMDEMLRRQANPSGAPYEYNQHAVHTKLMLIEADKRALELIAELWNSIPNSGEPVYDEFVDTYQEGEGWPPYTKAKGALRERVKFLLSQ